MIKTQETRDEAIPNAIVHLSREVNGTFRHRAELRLRSRQPFQMTQSVAVAKNAEI